MTNQERLNEAIRLIGEAASGLRTEGHACSSCGLTVRKHFAENQTADTLGGVLTKLRRTATNPDLGDWLASSGADHAVASKGAHAE
jgi:hypothetical protein